MRYLAILIAITSSGCWSAYRSAPVDGWAYATNTPNGKQGYTITCNHDESCWVTAGKYCNHGYDIVRDVNNDGADFESHSFSNRYYGGGVSKGRTTHKKIMVIECKAPINQTSFSEIPIVVVDTNCSSENSKEYLDKRK